MRKMIALASLLILGMAAVEKVPYPDGFRQWRHVKSALINPDSPAYPHFGGIHHIYANDKAIRGYETGRFADGSVLVFDVLAVETAKGATVERERRLVDVMHKDTTRFAATGGWGFEEFRGDTEERNIGPRAETECFKCHASKKEHDFVFSELRK
jgi:hypothetical protein